jgi:hypothetical protein
VIIAFLPKKGVSVFPVPLFPFLYLEGDQPPSYMALLLYAVQPALLKPGLVKSTFASQSQYSPRRSTATLIGRVQGFRVKLSISNSILPFALVLLLLLFSVLISSKLVCLIPTIPCVRLDRGNRSVKTN